MFPHRPQRFLSHRVFIYLFFCNCLLLVLIFKQRLRVLRNYCHTLLVYWYSFCRWWCNNYKRWKSSAVLQFSTGLLCRMRWGFFFFLNYLLNYHRINEALREKNVLFVLCSHKICNGLRVTGPHDMETTNKMKRKPGIFSKNIDIKQNNNKKKQNRKERGVCYFFFPVE